MFIKAYTSDTIHNGIATEYKTERKVRGFDGEIKTIVEIKTALRAMCGAGSNDYRSRAESDFEIVEAEAATCDRCKNQGAKKSQQIIDTVIDATEKHLEVCVRAEDGCEHIHTNAFAVKGRIKGSAFTTANDAIAACIAYGSLRAVMLGHYREAIIEECGQFTVFDLARFPKVPNIREKVRIAN